MKRIYFLNPSHRNTRGRETPAPAREIAPTRETAPTRKTASAREIERGIPKVEARLKETSLLLAKYRIVKDSGKGEEVLAEAIRNLMNAVEALQDEMLRISKA